VTDLELAAQIEHRTEGAEGKVDAAVDVSQVRQLDAECFVHWCKVDESVSGDVVLIQGPSRIVEPNVLLGPPHGMI
jgi:hypothetical protein